MGAKGAWLLLRRKARRKRDAVLRAPRTNLKLSSGYWPEDTNIKAFFFWHFHHQSSVCCHSLHWPVKLRLDLCWSPSEKADEMLGQRQTFSLRGWQGRQKCCAWNLCWAVTKTSLIPQPSTDCHIISVLEVKGGLTRKSFYKINIPKPHKKRMHLRVRFFQEESQVQTLVRPVCRCELCM